MLSASVTPPLTAQQSRDLTFVVGTLDGVDAQAGTTVSKVMTSIGGPPDDEPSPAARCTRGRPAPQRNPREREAEIQELTTGAGDGGVEGVDRQSATLEVGLVLRFG